MLIPSIDLARPNVVQLVQGERLALEDADLDGWIARFAAFPKLQLIDLDAAIGTGNNDSLVRYVCGARPCRVGGGIRSIERARDVLTQEPRTSSSARRSSRTVGPTSTSRRAGRGGRRRARHRRGRHQGRPRRRQGLARDRAAHGRRRRAGARAVLRRVPLHARGQGGPDAGHRHGGDPAVRRRDHPARSSPQAGLRRRKKSTRSTPLGVDAVVGMAIYTGNLKFRPPT